MDVVVRRAPGNTDLHGLVGTLFVDTYPTGQVFEVQFDPFVERVPNAQLTVSDYEQRGNMVHVTDAEDGREWRFEVYELDFEEKDDDPEDEED